MAHTYKFDLDEWNDACDHVLAKFERMSQRERSRYNRREDRKIEAIYAQLMQQEDHRG